MHHHTAVRVRARVASTVGMLHSHHHHRSSSFFSFPTQRVEIGTADTAASLSHPLRRRRSPPPSSSSRQRCQRRFVGTTIVDSNAQHQQYQQQQQQQQRKYSSSAQEETGTIAETAPATTKSQQQQQQQQQQHHHATNCHQSQRRHVAHVRNFVPYGPLPYEYGWIWQHVVLQRRLEYLRLRQQQQQLQQQQQQQQQQQLQQQHLRQQQLQPEQQWIANGSSRSNNNNDCILLFEHQPVYTLGRGASVDHLTFLRKENENNSEDEEVEEKEDAVLEDYRRRLCRTYRGEDASRLTCIDYSKQTNDGSLVKMAMSVEDEVALLQQQQQQNFSPAPPPVVAPNGAPIYRIERGGEVTFHGPGQLVLYPLLYLQHSSYQPDLHWYLHQIEEVIIQTLEYYNISSHRDTINTGVWVGTNKIAAVGVASSRWITSHGCALNVSPDLSYFGRDVITPCGIMAEGRGVTSIADILKGRRRSKRQHNSSNNSGIDIDDDEVSEKCPTVEEVAEVVLKCFAKVFEIELVPWGGGGEM